MRSMEGLMEILHQKQQEMQKQYDTKTTIGKAVEIPWKDHLPVKVIFNKPAKRPERKMPYFINAHGGAFIEGDALTMDSYCQLLADRLGILVVNLNYRLSPDYVYGYQIAEIEVVRDYVEKYQDELKVDAAKCGIGGFSAGATLSLSSIITNIQKGRTPYSCCVLGYPMTSSLPKSIDPFAPYQPGSEEMMSAIGIYTNGHESEPACSPLLADKEILNRFPPTILFTCGKDALSAQGRAFAKKLIESGVYLNFNEYKDAFHGFLEVNRPDYFPEDSRKTQEQLELTKNAEEFIIHGLTAMLVQ